MIEDRLLEVVSYNFSSIITFATKRVSLVSGFERRNAERSRPLYKFRAPYDAVRPEHHAVIQAAYIACLGPLTPFRFKDWADYSINDEIIGTAVGGVDETMQIIKPYTFGGVTRNRTITKPVDSTVFNKTNGYVEDAVALSVTEDSGGGPTPLAFTVDYTTGILTFTSTVGNTIRVTGEFDVPVIFDEDMLEFDFVEWEAHSTEIRLKEDFAA